MNPVEFAEKYLYPHKFKGNEIIPFVCPSCNGGPHRDRGTFALNIEKLTYNCRRGSCGVSGTFSALCKEYGEESDDLKEWKAIYIPKPKVYKKPDVKPKKVTNEVIEYFKTRGISEQTVKHWKIGCNDRNAIMFPYHENGELVLVKYRTIDKKNWRTVDSKPVFWGIDNADTTKPLWIVEGEIDCLTLYECGITNVVSVPSGSQDLDCVTHAWEKLERFEKIIVWNDQDAPGIEMRNELIKRLGDDRTYYIDCEYKDPNLLYTTLGKAAVVECSKHPKRIPVENMKRVAEVTEYDPDSPSIKTNIYGIDKVIGGLPLGHTTIVSGKRGGGKSTLLNTFIASAIEQNYGAWAFSGELQAGLFRYWSELTMAGRKNIITKDNPDAPTSYYIGGQYKELIRKWYYDSFFIYSSNEVATPDTILKTMEKCFKRYGTRLFIVDNIMMLNFGVGGEREKLDKQSDFVDKCVKFCQRYNTHVVIVQHPIKTKERITVDDIKGSGDITNRASITLLVHKVTQAEHADGVLCDSVVEIGKNRLNGREVDVELNFCEASKRMYGDSDNRDKAYSWEQLKPKPTKPMDINPAYIQEA